MTYELIFTPEAEQHLKEWKKIRTEENAEENS